MDLNKEKKEYIFAEYHEKRLMLFLPRFIFDINSRLRDFRLTIPEIKQIQQIGRVAVICIELNEKALSKYTNCKLGLVRESLACLEKNPENFGLLESLGKYTTYCRMDKIKSAVGQSGCVGFISILFNYIIITAVLLPFLCLSPSVLPLALFFAAAFFSFVGTYFVKQGIESIPLFNEQLGGLEKCLESDLISLINESKARETNEVTASEKINSVGGFQISEEPATQPSLYPPPYSSLFFNGNALPVREATNNNVGDSLYDRDRVCYK
ncbi:hypothetical protein RVIR1_13080 [Candidatus Rickettsiella viridis]|uniref:Uncharacterized protein n=1 Tax=Candidatus Rickettsiella viridis TaxID=676208 RepID=A0A2Z5V7T9_9COXI|nr:hypothetical protein [Candidatus Rickettsiella viridis]BBB15757.1 hypothetical protein RVIR1_13080 [Candidatus Rickettsiella viridis]